MAIGTKYALQKYPQIKKVLIYDWDVHHGNSTYKYLGDHPDVLFMSLHRYDGGSFYPNKPLADINHIGEGKGKGLKIHVPWEMKERSKLIGTQDYIYITERVLFPIAKEFQPDLILISSGFDSARGDPLGGLSVDPEGYAYIVRRLNELANSKIVIALEGGYNLDAIAMSAEASIRSLNNQPLPYEVSKVKQNF